jgi:branched-chain amino acid transport system substrate-binding protein
MKGGDLRKASRIGISGNKSLFSMKGGHIMKRFFLLCLLVGTIVFSGVCQAAEVPGVTDTEIKLGCYTALSGTLAYMGKALTEGAISYFNEVNAKGGVYGRKIVFIVEDDEYKPARSLALARKLITQDNIFAFVAPMGTATNLAAYPFIESQKVPIVGLLSISDAVTQPPLPYAFVLTTPQSIEAKVMVDYASRDLKLKSLGILYQNDEWGQNAYKQALSQMEKWKKQFTIVQTFERLAVDLSSQAIKMKEANPEGVILYALGKEAALFIKEITKMGWKPRLFGPAGLNDPTNLDLIGPGSEGLVIPVSYYPMDSDKPGIKKFLEAMKKYYPKSTPSMMGLMGWSAADLFVHCAQKIGRDLTREKLIDTLESLKDYDQGITVPLTFTKIGQSPDPRRGQRGSMLGEIVKGNWTALSGWIKPIE